MTGMVAVEDEELVLGPESEGFEGERPRVFWMSCCIRDGVPGFEEVYGWVAWVTMLILFSHSALRG